MPKAKKAIELDVFALYIEMGGMSQEFVAEVGRKFGKSDRTLRRWEKEGSWKEKAREPKAVAIQELETEQKVDAKELIAGFLDLCHTRITDIGIRKGYIDAIYATALHRIPTPENNPENPLKVDTIEDMERLTKMQVSLMKEEQNWAKLALLLVGEPDSRTETTINIAQAVMDGTYYKES